MSILVGYLGGGDYEAFWRRADVMKRVAGDESNRGLRRIGQNGSVIAVDNVYGSDQIVVVMVDRFERNFIAELNGFEIAKIGITVGGKGSVAGLAGVGGFGDVTNGEIESVGVGAFLGDSGNVQTRDFENAEGRSFFPELVSGTGIPSESRRRC